MILETTNTVIYKKEYMNRQDLVEICLPSQITGIEAWAFAYCENLKSIAIPDTVTSLGQDIFQGCKQLTDIVIYHNNTLHHNPVPDSANETIPCYNPISRLTAIAFTSFTRTALCIPADVGSETWIALWDETLLSYLGQSDSDGFEPFQAGGEEDYEDKDSDPDYYRHHRRMQKIRYIFERLLTIHAYPASDHVYNSLLSYLRQSEEITDVLIAEEARRYPFFKLSEELHLLDNVNIPELIAALPEEKVELKALLIRHQTNAKHENNHWDRFTL